jgi:fumarylacetoacetase
MVQIKAHSAAPPICSACEKLDFELELGAIIGVATIMGEPITVTEADDMIFGYVLLNDWSARDVLAWEYQPLGTFQAKAFATIISPWSVSPLALEPFRRADLPYPTHDGPLLPCLQNQGPMLFATALATSLQPEGASEVSQITKTNASHLYYAAAQQLAHHASSGCAMTACDLLGSGTISGPTAAERRSLLELGWSSAQPITLSTGEERCFWEDGDTLSLSGAAVGDGYQIGFDPCARTITPARNAS